MPENTCGEVSHRIQVIVGYHLWFATGSRGKVHNHGVFVVINESRTLKLRRFYYLSLIIAESLGDGLTMISNGDILFYRRTLWHGQANLFADISIIHTDDGLDRGTGITIHNIVFGEHVGCRDDDGANLAKGQHHNPPLVAALQNQHHRVALADTNRHEVGGSLVALFFQLLIGGTYLLALVVGPEQC